MPLGDKAYSSIRNKHNLAEVTNNQENHDTINTTQYINQIVSGMKKGTKESKSKSKGRKESPLVSDITSIERKADKSRER